MSISSYEQFNMRYQIQITMLTTLKNEIISIKKKNVYLIFK